MPLKIFYISSEVDPFANTFLLSKIAKKIAIKFQDNPEIEIRLLHPKYGFISERKYILREVIRLKDFPINFNNKEKLVSIKSAFIPESRAQIYFLEDENYFKPVPDLLYKSRNGRVCKDNDEKFLLFSKVALETLSQLLWVPDLIICNDWQTAFLPALFKEQYKKTDFFKNTKIIFTMLSLNDFRFYSNNSLSMLNLKIVNKDLKEQDAIISAIENSDKTICIDAGKELNVELGKNPIVNKALKKSNHTFINIPNTPSFSDWKEMISSFHSALNKS